MSRPMHAQIAALLVATLSMLPAAAHAASLNHAKTELARALETAKDQAARFAPYDAVFRRDPMQPIIDDQGGLLLVRGLSEGLSVQGIIWSDTRPLVIVDDELYGPGAMIGPYTIEAIEPTQVIVWDPQGQKVAIPLDRGVASVPAPQEIIN